MRRSKVLFVLLVSMIIGIIVFTGISRINGHTDIIRELEVKNNSSTDITATIHILHYKFREGIISAGFSAVEAFGPDLSLADKATFYWSLGEQKPFFHFNKAIFDLRTLNIPNDIQKVEFVYNGNDDCWLNLYSVTQPMISLKQKSIKLDKPLEDRY